jgi:hypothetical protein
MGAEGVEKRSNIMKKIAFIKRSSGRHWVGNGFPVQSIFSYNDIAEEMSPFLLMDYAGPADFAPTTERRGVGQHPHPGLRDGDPGLCGWGLASGFIGRWWHHWPG